MNSLPQEVWETCQLNGVTIPEYLVSDLGNVRRSPDYLGKSHGRKLSHIRHDPKKPIDKCYMYIILSINGRHQNAYVHRLVTSTFKGYDSTMPFVNHINGNKSDNRLVNLEWVTHQMNIDHAIATGLANKKGENHHGAKLTDIQAIEIEALARSKCATQQVIGERYGVGVRTVAAICQHRSWKHLW